MKLYTYTTFLLSNWNYILNKPNIMKHIYILMLGILAVSCSSTSTEIVSEDLQQPSPAPNDTVKIDATTGATEPERATILNGIFIVPPQRQATVSLNIGGIVRNTTLIAGKHVQKGETIATIENSEFIDMQQNYLDAEAKLEYYGKEFARQQNLVSEQVASLKQYQQSKAEYMSVKSKAEALSAQLSLLGIDASRLKETGIVTLLEIKSPIDGFVSNININIGKYITRGEAICEVIDKDYLMIQLTAYEKDLHKLHTGDDIKFSVNGMDGRTFEAVLVSIDQNVDRANRSIKAFAELKSSDPVFRPGMYVSAEVR